MISKDGFSRFIEKSAITEYDKQKGFIYKWIKVYDKLIKHGTILIVYLTESHPVFGSVCSIAETEVDIIKITFQLFETLGYDQHLHAYYVKLQNDIKTEELQEIDKLHVNCLYHMSYDGNSLININSSV